MCDLIITTQPDHIYYSWQIHTQLYNLYRVLDIKIPYICLLTKESSQKINVEKLKKLYPFFNAIYYEDTRYRKDYQPSLQPHLLSKYFKDKPDLYFQRILYLDADAIAINPSVFKLSYNCYSDTDSYLGVRYIQSKGKEELLNNLCQIVGVNVEKIYKKKHGGAQYLISELDSNFWQKVENDCYKIFDYLNKSVEYYKNKSGDQKYTPIQVWTSSMWAIFYNLILFEIEISISDIFNFCWPTDNINKWDNNGFYHNAGVINSTSGMFYKGEFINTPPTLDILSNTTKYQNTLCSYNYVELLKDVCRTESFN